MKIKVVFVLLSLVSFNTWTNGEVERTKTQEPAISCYESHNALKISPEPCEDALQLAKDPKERALILSNLAIIQAKLGQMPGAQISITEALKLSPRDPSIYINLGNLRIRQKLFKEAIDAFDLASQLGARRDPSLYLNKSIAQRGLGRYFEAQESFIQYKLLTDESAHPLNQSE